MSSNGTTFVFSSPGRQAPEVLIVPVASDPKPSMKLLAGIDTLCDGAASELVELLGVPDEVGRIFSTTRRSGIHRVAIVSTGPDAKLQPHKLREAAGAAARWLTQAKVKSAGIAVDGLLGANFEEPVGHWALGMHLAGWKFEEFKNSENNKDRRVKVSLHSGEPAQVARVMGEVEHATTLAEAVNFARTIAHRPPNVLHPTSLADEARALAKGGGLKCTVFDHQAVRKMGMGGLLAVGMASEHLPCLIRLDYRGNARGRQNVVVVGKAITFDTGGISIKPSAGMEKMKFDKCGGMAVLGLMKACRDLKLRCNVTGLIAAAENTLSDEAYRPSDILTMASGKTVEVISTDAEGRLVLADALWYAQEHCAPTVIIDLATLTGGVITALGVVAAGMMTNNDDLASELDESGRRTHERLWRLPLWDDYRDLIKGTDSDIKNSSGSRYAHPIVGGMFLKEFVKDDVPWAHLDIAGTATDSDEKVATGFGVRLLVDFLKRRG